MPPGSHGMPRLVAARGARAKSMRFRRLRDRMRAAGAVLQKRFAQVALVFIYLFGFGLMKVWALVFHRALVRPSGAKGSLWLKTLDHEFDAAESERQS